MTEHVIRSGLAVYRITGDLLAEVTTERPWKDRWTEMALYRATGSLVLLDEHGAPAESDEDLLPHGGYVTYMVGQSVRAHDPDADCQEGVPTPMAKLPIDAQPCPECKPVFPHVPLVSMSDTMRNREEARVRAERAGDTRMFDLEVIRHTIYPAGSAQEAFDGLTRRGMSVPAERLLRKAALKDPGIAAILARLDAYAGEAV